MRSFEQTYLNIVHAKMFQSHSTLCKHMGFSRPEYQSRLPCFPPGIFLTQGLNLLLLEKYSPVFLPGESMDRRTWWATVSRVAKSMTEVTQHAHTSTLITQMGLQGTSFRDDLLLSDFLEHKHLRSGSCLKVAWPLSSFKFVSPAHTKKKKRKNLFRGENKTLINTFWVIRQRTE